MRVAVHPPPGQEAVTTRWVSGHREAGIQALPLTLRSILLRRVDVVHVHWPEHLVRASRYSWAKALWASVLILSIWVSRKPLVLTLHNLEPHEALQRRRDRWLVARIKALARGIVTLVPPHEELIVPDDSFSASALVRSIPFGPLSIIECSPSRTLAPGDAVRLLFLGSVAAYKGQLEVTQALAPLAHAGDVELLIAGRSPSPDYRDQVREIVRDLPGCNLSEDWLDDAELAEAMEWCDAVIGYQAEGLNTGVIYSAVPSGRPVVCGPTMQAIAEKKRFGAGWIVLLDDAEHSDAWRRVATEIRHLSGTPRPQADVSWAESGLDHLRLYKALVATSDV